MFSAYRMWKPECPQCRWEDKVIRSKIKEAWLCTRCGKYFQQEKETIIKSRPIFPRKIYTLRKDKKSHIRENE
jgi:transposase-like protein